VPAQAVGDFAGEADLVLHRIVGALGTLRELVRALEVKRQLVLQRPDAALVWPI
jgi:hypothetical protein